MFTDDHTMTSTMFVFCHAGYALLLEAACLSLKFNAFCILLFYLYRQMAVGLPLYSYKRTVVRSCTIVYDYKDGVSNLETFTSWSCSIVSD